MFVNKYVVLTNFIWSIHKHSKHRLYFRCVLFCASLRDSLPKIENTLQTFLAKLFPHLCLCHWNGNYDLFSNFVNFFGTFVTFFSNFMTFLWPLWPFYDLFSTFVTFLWMTKKVTILLMTKWYYLDLIVIFLWPFQYFYDLFVNDKMILSWSNCDLFMPFSALFDLFVNDKKGHNFMNNKIILSRSYYDLFINDTI